MDENGTPHKLVIDRNIWLRGVGSAGSRLLTEREGKRCQCCVGVYLTSLGVPDEALKDQSAVDDSLGDGRFQISPTFSECGVLNYGGVPTWLLRVRNKHGTYGDVQELYSLNDYSGYGGFVTSEEDREAKIKAIFLRNGVEVEFVG